MKPLLLIGLGNPLMGDDGVGCLIADRLATDPRLPDDVEAIAGGTDLLRFADAMEGRRRVILVDAVQDGAAPGTVTMIEEGAMGDRQEFAHHLSAAQAIQLIKLTMPVSITLVGVSITSASMRLGLSPPLCAVMPTILDRVLEELRWSSST
jgi:hydrogenase maturation protease